jgi:NAD(P)-dependent dehydrogenase (short-subunit alcohol dehydrogenase family)
MMRLRDKVAVVTGSASGIGTATARRLASEGAEVVIADIDDQAGENAATQIRAEGGSARYVRCDVTLEKDWVSLKKQTLDHFGRVDVLCSNASAHMDTPAHELPPEGWDRELRVNLTPLYHALRTFHQELSAYGGCIVATSSVHAHFGLPGYPAYAAAKAGLCGLVRQLAVEYGPQIRVNAVLPGPILTPAWDETNEHDRKLSARATTLARMGHPDEVASAVAFLASSDASYITGTELVVDGGWSIKKESK